MAEDKDQQSLEVDGRDKKGRFLKGSVGNPTGKGGHRSRAYRDMLHSNAPEILAMLFTKAREGDSMALRICAERLLPAIPKSSLPEVEVLQDGAETREEAAEKIIEAAISGLISIDHANQFLAAFKVSKEISQEDGDTDVNVVISETSAEDDRVKVEFGDNPCVAGPAHGAANHRPGSR